MKTIEITDVGAVQHLSIPIRPGLVVLAGANGRGKTTALRAVEALASGDGSSLEVRDGAGDEARGVVEGLGARLTVGRRRESATAAPTGKSRVTGELEVRTLDGINPLEFVEPGVQEPTRADARRIAILCDLAGIKPSFALFEDALGKETVLHATKQTREKASLPEQASALKRDLQTGAREVEQALATVDGKIQAHLAASGGVEPTAPAEEPDHDALQEAALREYHRLQGEAAAASRARSAASNARRMLTTARETYDGPSPDQLEAAITETEQQVASLRDALLTANAKLDSLKAQESLALQHVENCAAWEACVTEAEGLPTVTDEQLDEARRAVENAKAAKDAAILIGEQRRRRRDADALLPKRDELRKKADALRAAAEQCESVVSGAISRVAPAGLRVKDERLVVDTARGETLVADLSFGEACSLAVGIAAKSLGKDALLVIPQNVLEGLDPTKRAELDTVLREHGVCGLSAEATEGALRVEAA